jgi:hypothetical protein
MTKDEFWESYKVLNKKFPDKYHLQDAINQRLFFDMVKELDVRWFNRNIARAILMNNPKFDFRAAAAGELRSRNSLQKTMEIVNKKIDISEDSLEKHLASIGATSLIDCLKIKSQNETP